MVLTFHFFLFCLDISQESVRKEVVFAVAVRQFMNHHIFQSEIVEKASITVQK